MICLATGAVAATAVVEFVTANVVHTASQQMCLMLEDDYPQSGLLIFFTDILSYS